MAEQQKQVKFSLDEAGGCDPNQASLTSSSLGRPKKPVELTVYSANTEHKERFDSGILTSADEIKKAIFRILGLFDDQFSNVFSIWMVSKHLQLQLNGCHLPCKLFKRWKDLAAQFTNISSSEVQSEEPLLVFQRNAFFDLKEERKLLSKIKDQDSSVAAQARTVIDLLFHEAKANVLQAHYPLPAEECRTLAGYLAAIELGQYDPASTGRPENLKRHCESFYPQHMLGSSKKLFKSSSEKLEHALAGSYEEASRKSSDPFNLKVLYLQLCWSKSYYGAVMFHGQIERLPSLVDLLAKKDRPVILAVNPDCIHLFKASQPRDTLLYLTYDQFSWALEPAQEEGEHFYACLWLEFDSVIDSADGNQKKIAKRIQIFSRQAPLMDAMIERCVNSINEKEATLRRVKKAQDHTEDLPELPRYVWPMGQQEPGQQKLKQDLNCKENKLVCTVISPEGEVVEPTSRFASLKRKKTTPSNTARLPDHPSRSPEADTLTDVDNQPLTELRAQKGDTAENTRL